VSVWASAFKFGNFSSSPHIIGPDSREFSSHMLRRRRHIRNSFAPSAGYSNGISRTPKTEYGACYSHYCSARVAFRCEYRTYTSAEADICHRHICTYVVYISMNMSHTSWYLQRSLDNYPYLSTNRRTLTIRLQPFDNLSVLCRFL